MHHFPLDLESKTPEMNVILKLHSKESFSFQFKHMSNDTGIMSLL